MEVTVQKVSRDIAQPFVSRRFRKLAPSYFIFKHNQQDASLHNGIYYYKYSTCFRRSLRPSSGAQNCIHISGYLSSYREWVHSHTIAVRSRKSSTNTRWCVYSFELLMMGGGMAWNLYSIYSNKYHCVRCIWLVMLEYIKDARPHERKKISSIMSVRPHETTRLPLSVFSWNLIFEDFSKIRPENSSLIKIWQQRRLSYMKTCVHFW
jgi:hypothetical protein